MTHPPAPAGTSCSDGDACNGEETCNDAGTCVSGSPPTIDDGVACSLDICRPDTGVIHTPCEALDLTVGTTLYEAKKFLFLGPNAIQTGLDPADIDPVRISVLRGRVTDIGGAPLPGVTVHLLERDPNEPSYGETLSQGNGEFHLAVNGGATLRLAFEKDGYLTVHRPIDAPWADYGWLEDDVVMTGLDPAVTAITLDAADMQAAQASLVTDDNGSRRATVLIAAGTEAALILPDGSSVAATELHLRATEYTVGDSGPLAMPAPLPPTSAYTYAVDITADEALAAGASRIELSAPAIFYLDNYREFSRPVLVPVGFYDRKRGEWIASPDGLVVKIVSETNGLADLDFDGDDIGEPQALYDALAVSDDERAKLVELYEPGQSFWRVALDHFSPYDLNLGYPGDPNDCAPGSGACMLASGPSTGKDSDQSCNASSSIIECQNQILHESIPVAGTPFSLHYASDRVPGRKSARRLTLPLTGEQGLPASVTAIRYQVLVAARTLAKDFACAPFLSDPAPECAPNSSADVLWDGRDDQDRVVQGPQPATVRIGYEYTAYFNNCPGVVVSGGSSGGGSSGGGSGGAIDVGAGSAAPKTFAKWPSENNVSINIQSQGCTIQVETTFWTNWRLPLGAWSSVPLGLGGFSLDVHHGYNPMSGTLFLGNGERRNNAGLEPILRTVAGGGPPEALFDDGGPAIGAFGGAARGIAVAKDGTVYYADSASHRIRAIGTDGTIRSVAGSGDTAGFSGDGGPATSATLRAPHDVAIGPDGSLYIADLGNHRIRRVDPFGTITTFAGASPNPLQGGGFAGDGGPAEDAELRNPRGVAVAPDGSVFVADTGNRRIRHIATDGIIETVAGGGNGTAPGPAVGVHLFFPNDVAVGPNGSFYIAEGGDDASFIYRVLINGSLKIVAGKGGKGTLGDGGPAVDAFIDRPQSLAVRSDGSVYFTVYDVTTTSDESPGIRWVDSFGIIRTIAGTLRPDCGSQTFCGEEGPATAAQLLVPHAIAAAPDESLYFGDVTASRVFRIAPVLPGVAPGETVVASDDGGELYRFDSFGRHLETRDGALGTTLYGFDYDAAGRLEAISDVDGRVTTVAHDANGNPTAVIGPFGHTTSLSTNAEGYIGSLEAPLLNPFSFGYSATAGKEGLLVSMTDPRGFEKTYGFNANGYLATATAPTEFGGTQAFTRIEKPNDAGHTVVRTSALGRVTHYDVTWGVGTAPSSWTVTAPDGIAATTLFGNNAVDTTTLADGTVITSTEDADPRWGMYAPIPKELTVETGGKLLRVTTARTVTDLDELNPLSFTTETDAVTINGKTFTTTLDKSGALPKLVRATPAGRTSETDLDDKGRPTRVTVTSSALLDPTELSYYDPLTSLDPKHAGLLRQIKQGSGASARVYELFYDDDGNLATVKAPLGKVVSFGYDAATRVRRKTFPDGESVRFDYDDSGNLTVLEQPGSPLMPPASTVHTFESNAVDLLSLYTAPDVGLSSHSTSFSYSLDKELDLVTRPDGLTINPEYDAAGRLTDVMVPGGAVQYDYFAANDAVAPGKLQAVTSTVDGVSVEYGYAGSLLTSTTWSGAVSGTVSREYDDDLRLASESVNGVPVAFQYNDADGLLTSAGDLALTLDPGTGLLTASTLGGIEESYAYNQFGELVTHLAYFEGLPLYSLELERDALGRITRKEESVLGEPAVGRDYGYDLAGRLADVHVGGVHVAHYEYDENGNRTLVEDPSTGAMEEAVYDAQDRLLSRGSASYTYSAAGELRTRTDATGTTSFEYDVLGNLRSVETPAGDLTEYTLDGNDRRVRRLVNGFADRFVLYRDGLALVRETDGDTFDSRFVYGTRAHVADYMIRNGARQRLLTDHVGSVRLVVDADTGAMLQRLDYDDWGVVLSDSLPGYQPFGFAGGIYDSATGLVRFGARDYDARSGRWTAKEAALFLGGTNLYAYGFNDPVNLVDPTGRNPALVLAVLAVGWAWGGATYFATADVGQESPSGVLQAGVLGAAGAATGAAAAGLAAEALLLTAAEAAGPAALSKAERAGLRDLFGSNERGAQQLIDRLQRGENVDLPFSVSRQTLEAYRVIAQRMVDTNNDIRGTQQLRLRAIDLLLCRLNQ